MKPYEIINCLLQTIINECYPGEIEYYIFEDNVRWDDSPDIFGPSATNRVGYGNLKRAKLAVEHTYYDYHNKSWRDANDMSRIFPSVIDHSFEPIHYEMDITLWNRAYKKYHPWPTSVIPKDPFSQLEIKDYPRLDGNTNVVNTSVALIHCFNESASDIFIPNNDLSKFIRTCFTP